MQRENVDVVDSKMYIIGNQLCNSILYINNIANDIENVFTITICTAVYFYNKLILPKTKTHNVHTHTDTHKDSSTLNSYLSKRQKKFNCSLNIRNYVLNYIIAYIICYVIKLLLT